ncbi:hypothetical protein, partial [Flavobacterium sp. UBA6031]|uniref:hypothetical protein n=1 Tax=Flavobacterium sp. UBA6031 TaxID=1946551 RepID=UPI0025C13918
LKEMHLELNQLMARKRELPFLSSLEEFKDKLERLSNKEYSYFLSNLKDFEDHLLDSKENLLDPIKRFMNGDQVKIYEGIRAVTNG